MTQQQCVDNVLAAITAAVDKMPRKWDGVQVRCLAQWSCHMRVYAMLYYTY